MANAGLPSHAVAPLCSIIRILYRPRRRERRRAVAVSPSGGAVPDPPPVLLPLDRLTAFCPGSTRWASGTAGADLVRAAFRSLLPGNRCLLLGGKGEPEDAVWLISLPGMCPVKIWATATMPWICHG
jgi:hypothetical protein